MGLQRKTLVDGIVFGEGPRWHDGRLWFSDMYAQAVILAYLCTFAIFEVFSPPPDVMLK